MALPCKAGWWYLLLAGLCFTGSAHSAVTNWVGDEQGQVRLRSAYAQVAPGQQFRVALEQQLAPGVHSLWRNPGDAQQVTRLQWQLPTGWQADALLWPAPAAIAVGPLTHFGFRNEAALLTTIQVPATQSPGAVTLQAELQWWLCTLRCTPQQATLRLPLQVGEPLPSTAADQLQAAQAALPAPWPGSASAALVDNQLLLQLRWPESWTPPPAAAAHFFPDTPDSIDNGATQRARWWDDTLELQIPLGFSHPATWSGVLVLTTAEGAVASFTLEPVGVALSAESAASDIQAPALGWLTALAFALVGGLILNLMPCVFPVLSIKLLALMQMGGNGQARQLALHGFVYGIGVVLGFLALALVLILLRGSGLAVGWGFHLQNPVVVLLLVWLFLLIGLNLSGVFEVGQRLMGVGQGLTEGHGLRPSFFTGLLATLVATPCTAPLMGVALGYALVQPPAMTLLIFAGLGLGMALPFVLLCVVPGALAWLPRPGPWMVRFKEALAFPMYASGIWLIWVLTQQTGSDGVLLALGGALILVLALWLGRQGGPGLRWLAWVLGVGGVAGGLYLASMAGPQAVTAPASSQWQPYSAEAVAAARAQGPVFVNFTADWCITCKANERIAIETTAVQALFVQKGVARIKADWTSYDADISRAIESFNRSGVPLYLFYAEPDQAQPQILPQLLTETMLVRLLTPLPDVPEGSKP